MAGVDGTRLYKVMEALAACLCEALEDSQGGAPCFCGVIPGQSVAMDYCDCDGGPACGQAWVRLDSLFPSDSFPIPQQAARSCRTPWAARVEVGVTRCWPGMDEAGNPPDAADQANAVLTQLGDMGAMLTAIDCCLEVDEKDYIAGQYSPLGPMGNCGGGTILVTIWFPDGL